MIPSLAVPILQPTLIGDGPKINQNSALGRIVSSQRTTHPVWIAPSFKVVEIPYGQNPRFSPAVRRAQILAKRNADVIKAKQTALPKPQLPKPQLGHDPFAGKSVLQLCWEMCVRVPYLTRRIAALTANVAKLPRGKTRNELKRELLERILDKQIAFPCFQDRKAGIEAYQKALLDGRCLSEAIYAGYVAENKAIGPYNPAKQPKDYLALDVPELKRSSAKRKRFKKDIGYRVCPAIYLPEREVGFNVVTPEDVDWAQKQKAFPHSYNMPPVRKNLCTQCAEVVIDENGNVLRKTLGVYLPVEHECPKVIVHDAVPVPAAQKQNARHLARRQREPVSATEVIAGLYEVPSIWAGFANDEVFVGTCQGLENFDNHLHDPRRNNSVERANELFEAKQQWKQAGVEAGRQCLRCGGPVLKRKGTLHCSDNCRKRHHEQLNTTKEAA